MTQPTTTTDAGAAVAAALAALTVAPTAVVELPERPGLTAPWPLWVDPSVKAALQRSGVRDLWQHQAVAADSAQQRRHTVLATGTASGKSISYWLPALTRAVQARATTLYCTPTKALAQDQRARIAALDLPEVAACCYDGDTDPELRGWIRRSSRFVLTNPDMLHRSIVPRHAQWRVFLARLEYVVLDEGHMYRGVFGSNVAAVLARLRRVCRAAGADPTFIVSSATLGDPAGSAAALLGMTPDEIVAIADDTSARGARTVVLVDPSTAADEGGQPPSAFGEVARVLTRWTSDGVQSVGFARSRAAVEALAQRVGHPDGAEVGGTDVAATRVTAYRGGLLPEERRTIEAGLRSGDLRCVAATNALELGVDITGLDAVAMCGWPGTRLSFHQQLGRAGRNGGPALAVLAAQADPLDRYFVHHPERIFGDAIESTVIDARNPHILAGHVAAAVAELPVTATDASLAFGCDVTPLLKLLARRGLVRRRGDRWHWVAREAAHQFADLRGAGQPVTIVEDGTGRVMGTMDGSSAHAQLHPGAVYTHLGRTYLIESLDLETGVAVARRARPGYTTIARSVSDLRIVTDDEQRPLGGGSLHFGAVKATSQVVGYLKRAAGTGQVLGSEPLDLPPRRLRTRGVWWRLPDRTLQRLDLPEHRLPGAAHAAEHAAIGVLPALATCDRWDIGGLSTALHPDTGELTVFVYDGHPGGAGFARRAYDAAEQWLRATHDVVTSCECGTGCPGCVQSPKCGNGNEPLDRPGAITLLAALLGLGGS